MLYFIFSLKLIKWNMSEFEQSFQSLTFIKYIIADKINSKWIRKFPFWTSWIFILSVLILSYLLFSPFCLFLFSYLSSSFSYLSITLKTLLPLSRTRSIYHLTNKLQISIMLTCKKELDVLKMGICAIYHLLCLFFLYTHISK